MGRKSNLKWIDKTDEVISTETKSLTETSIEMGKKGLETTIGFTKMWSSILGILFLILSTVFVFLFAGSYQLFFIAMSENVFVSVAVFVLGALLTTSFFSKLIFMLIPEAVVTKVAAMLHVPFEVAIVLVLIVIMALFAALSALVFFILAFMFLGVGALIRLAFKKSSGIDVGVGVISILLSVPALFANHIVGVIFGIFMILIGVAHLIPVKAHRK